MREEQIEFKANHQNALSIFTDAIARHYLFMKVWKRWADTDEMRVNLHTNCLPERMFNGNVPDLDGLLEIRRKTMIKKIKAYFEGL